MIEPACVKAPLRKDLYPKGHVRPTHGAQQELDCLASHGPNLAVVHPLSGERDPADVVARNFRQPLCHQLGIAGGKLQLLDSLGIVAVNPDRDHESARLDRCHGCTAEGGSGRVALDAVFIEGIGRELG